MKAFVIIFLLIFYYEKFKMHIKAEIQQTPSASPQLFCFSYFFLPLLKHFQASTKFVFLPQILHHVCKNYRLRTFSKVTPMPCHPTRLTVIPLRFQSTFWNDVEFQYKNRARISPKPIHLDSPVVSISEFIEKNPRTWDVNCRHGVGLLSTSATCSGPPLGPGECHTGNRVHACSVSSLVLSISKLHKYWFLPRKVQRWTDIPACCATPQIQGSPWVLKTLPMPKQGTSGHFPHLVSLQLLLFHCLISQMPLLKHPGTAVSRLAPEAPLWP